MSFRERGKRVGLVGQCTLSFYMKRHIRKYFSGLVFTTRESVPLIPRFTIAMQRDRAVFARLGSQKSNSLCDEWKVRGVQRAGGVSIDILSIITAGFPPGGKRSMPPSIDNTPVFCQGKSATQNA